MALENTEVISLEVRQIAELLKPGQSLQDWLLWPPDVFALTSTIMQRTGCYRIALIETEEISNAGKHEDDANKRSYWETEDWYEFLSEESNYWLSLVGNAHYKKKVTWEHATLDYEQLEDDLGKSEDFLKGLLTYWQEITTSDVKIDSLRTISTDSFDTLLFADDRNNDNLNYYNKQKAEFDRNRKLAISIAKLHALADLTCAGFGLVNELRLTSLEKYEYKSSIKRFAHMVANFLLVSTGSLSTITKFHGVVLPKMRTPQVGIVLRSVSHHLTFHITEVEVIWRTIPWLKSNEKSLNIIAIPSPFTVSEKDFKILEEKYHSVRYFKPELDVDEKESDAFIESVINLVINQHKAGTIVHLIIFPEMSLKLSEYEALLQGFHKVLENRSKILMDFKLPMIIAGVISKGNANYFNNEVRIASYFAGRWYDVNQRKHHRWQLNRDQIIQYNLQNKLPTDRLWFEHTSVSQRRLTVLAPNSWLVLTALICEDLARLEPVSEVIRGIGPTFLTALLSDGPQLTERWSARYASVLADDPGTAVLTLTSYCMSTRSKRQSNDYREEEATKETVVGLWKDLVQGYKRMYTTGKDKALLMTISAEYKEEVTLDDRVDGGAAAVFKLDGVKEIAITSGDYKHSNQGNIHLYGNWEDIRQLSFFVFALDTAIELLLTNSIKSIEGKKMFDFGMCAGFWTSILDWLGMKEKDVDDPENRPKTDTLNIEEKKPDESDSYIKKLIFKSLESPKNAGVGVRNFEKWPSEEVLQAFAVATNIYKNTLSDVQQKIKWIETNHSECVMSVFELLFKQANSEFDREYDYNKRRQHPIYRRIRLAVPVSIVMSIDNKLSHWNIRYGSNLEKIKLLRSEMKNFLDESYRKTRIAK